MSPSGSDRPDLGRHSLTLSSNFSHVSKQIVFQMFVINKCVNTEPCIVAT